jgi:hypothetical protein
MRDIENKPVEKRKSGVGLVLQQTIVSLANWFIYTIIAIFNLTKAVVYTIIGILIRPFDKVAIVSSAFVDYSPSAIEKRKEKGENEDE